MENDFGVIFDMDGVLVDSNPAHKEVIKQFCKKYQKDVTEDFLRQRVYGRTNKEWIPEVFGDLPEKYSEKLADEKEKMFRDMFEPDKHIIPGLIGFLGKLRQSGIKCVLATSAPKENAVFILSELGIEKYFIAVLDSSDVNKGKPEPDVYLKAAKKAGYPPEKCIIFEDSIAGVEAGLRAGAKVIGITTTHHADELSECSKVISNFKEVTVADLLDIVNIPYSQNK
jgi:beta-phosphoglucomutase